MEVIYILNYLNNDALLFISTGLLFWIMLKNFAKRLPDLLSDRIKFKDNRQLQIESYFREFSGNKQQKILEGWANEFYKVIENDEADDKKEIEHVKRIEALQQLFRDTITYSSPKTTRCLSSYSRHIYTSEKGDGLKEGVYFACMISSLKLDFSGYYVDPLDLLKIRITDFDKHEKIFKKYILEIENETKEKF